MLADLDRVRPQVLIKVLIADVTLDDRTQFGVEGFWENKMHTRSGETATNRFSTDFALATQGFTYLLTGDEFQATLNLFAAEGKLKILATPRILVLDNQTANIQVGKEVPIITGTTINSLGNTQNSVDRQNVGVLLDVTPHINPDGLVTLVVSPEISDVASEAESVKISDTVSSPTFNVNRATTTVAVRNGTTVAIGGLIRETVDDAVQKIPILGDIPILGAVFSNTNKHKVKRELMIFLTPYVAYTAAEIEEITQLEKSKLKLLDLRDLDAESDRWLQRVRK
jgi:general secretion pathway protein D